MRGTGSISLQGNHIKTWEYLRIFGIGDKEIKVPHFSVYFADSVRFQVKRAGRGFKKLSGRSRAIFYLFICIDKMANLIIFLINIIIVSW